MKKKYRKILLDGLKDESRIVKKTILERFYDKEDKEAFKTALSSEDFFVSVMAASGLALLGDNSGFEVALKGIESKDEEIREVAFEALENMKDKRAIPYLKNLRKKVKDKELKKRIKEVIKEIKK